MEQKPQAVAWTKTAGEILETLAAYCTLINEPGH